MESPGILLKGVYEFLTSTVRGSSGQMCSFAKKLYFCKMFSKIIRILVVFVALATASCNPYQKLLKSTDNELKYSKAMEYYDNGKYLRAQQLFDQIQPYFRGTEKAELIAYNLANTYFKQKDYILGGYYFKQFATNYAASPLAEEAAYQSAYCNYIESPISSLDQTSSIEAITSLQAFKSQYPNSSRLADADKLIHELNSKLEKKAIDIALLYYRMNDYKAAIIAFNNVLKDYPDTKYKEEILFKSLQIKYQYAHLSIPEKKAERFADATETYEDLAAGFPTGTYIAKAKAILAAIEKEQPRKNN